jgi:predicted flavoprotein YhiN
MEDEIVELNVGGTHYTTTRTTLSAFPESMLAALVRDNGFDLKKRADGRVFIDRDGKLFKYILQFLRDRDLDVEVLRNDVVTRLKREAAFFCLDELENKIGNTIQGNAKT